MAVTDIVADLIVEVGFGANAVGGDYFVLGDPVKGELGGAYVLAPDTVFVDIRDHVAAITTNRGRNEEIDQYKAGSAAVVLNDNDRTFDPGSTDSPYAGEFVPMKRANIRWNGNDIFVGWVTDWSINYEPGDTLSRVSADCADGFVILANQELPTITPAFSGELSGARVTRILDRPDVLFPATRSIDTGNSTFGATSLGANALQYLQDVARAEAGYLFVAADGTLMFRGRLATLNAESDVVFSDNPDNGIPYQTVTQRSASSLLYTRVTGASETTSNELEATNPGQPDEYFVRTLDLGTLFTIDDAETQTILDYYFSRFSEPELRFETATVNTGALSESQVAALLALDLTDVVTVERVPLGAVPKFRYLEFPGTTGNYVSAPDAADLDIVGNITIVVRFAPDVLATNQTLVSKWTNTGNQRSYRLDLNASDGLSFVWSTTGADNPSAVSPSPLPMVVGEWIWAAIAFDIDEAGFRVANFWYSTQDVTDPADVTWQLLGTAAPAAATSIFSSTAVVNLSGHTLGTVQPFDGKIGFASISQGVGSSTTVGGTEMLRFDGSVDLDTFIAGYATTFTATTGETLTLEGSATVGSQAPATISRTCLIDGIAHTITPGSWLTEFTFSNADTRSFLMLGDPVFGRIGFNRLAF